MSFRLLVCMEQYLVIYILDPSGNPVTEQLQSVVVTDASGNPVTGMCKYNYTKSN